MIVLWISVLFNVFVFLKYMVCQNEVEFNVTKRLFLVFLNVSISNVNITKHILIKSE